MGFQYIILGLLVVGGITCLSNVYAYDFFAKNNPEQIVDEQHHPENTDLNQIQKHLAEQHDQEENDYEILKNPFYSN